MTLGFVSPPRVSSPVFAVRSRLNPPPAPAPPPQRARVSRLPATAKHPPKLSRSDHSPRSTAAASRCSARAPPPQRSRCGCPLPCDGRPPGHSSQKPAPCTTAARRCHKGYRSSRSRPSLIRESKVRQRNVLIKLIPRIHDPVPVVRPADVIIPGHRHVDLLPGVQMPQAKAESAIPLERGKCPVGHRRFRVVRLGVSGTPRLRPCVPRPARRQAARRWRSAPLRVLVPRRPRVAVAVVHLSGAGEQDRLEHARVGRNACD